MHASMVMRKALRGNTFTSSAVSAWPVRNAMMDGVLVTAMLNTMRKVPHSCVFEMSRFMMN